jgi:hypothetical protein
LILTIKDYLTDPAGLTYNVDVGSVIGSTGARGITGATGATGAPGATGVTGVNISNAIVSGGRLILTLSSGVTFNAGNVAGPTGPMGATSTCPSCVDPLGGTGGTAYGCADLIKIEKLVLSDTFQTWYDRTNQIIEAVNPVNLYEIAGLTGIELISGRSNCNYNGIVGISFKHGPGMTWGSADHTLTGGLYYNKMFVDPATLPTVTGLYTVANNDLFMFKDMSDTTQVYSGTPKSVPAEFMAPPRLTFDQLELNGDVVINGNFTIVGSQSNVGTNNIVVESKNLNLAYQRSGLITITGPSASINQLYQIGIVGASAFYDDVANNPGTTASTIGVVKSITGPANGLTAQVSIGSIFSAGNPDDFQTAGIVRFVSVTGATFSVLSADGATTNFFNDNDLDGAGIIIKGLSGDKYFTWENCSKAWISDKNLGVDTSLGFITARNYRNVCLQGDGLNEFNFYGVSGQSGHVTLRLGHDQAGRWAWSYAHNLPGSPLLLKNDSTTSGSEYTLATIYGLTTGPHGFTQSIGGTSNMFAKGFNADFLDGAGATTGTPYGNIGEPNEGNPGSTAYSIPISDNRGRINANWLESDSNRIRVYQTAHGLTNGNCIIREVGSVMGPTAAKYIVASPFSNELAEAVGIVVEVIDANQFVYVNSGLATIPVPPDIKPGVSLLLAANGGLTTDYGNEPFYIEKTMFMPVAITGSVSNRKATGIVMSQPGFLVGGTSTDQIYAKGLVPVGTIVPYSGDLNLLSDSWIVCNGGVIRPGQYPELYKVIGLTGNSTDNQRYYADVKVTSTSSQNFNDEDGILSGQNDSLVTMFIKGGTRGFSVSANPVLSQGDLIKLAIYSNVTKSIVTERDARVWSINGSYELAIALRNTAVQAGYTRDDFVTLLNSVKSNKDYSVRLYGRHRTDALSIWGTTILPDIRSRTVYGAGEGSNQYDNGAQMAVGDLVDSLGYSISGGYPSPLGGDTFGGVTGSAGVTGYKYTPGIVTNYIIRATPEVNALILSGHNHDDRYVRFDLTGQSLLHVGSGYTAQNRDNARYNIQALSRETGDVHTGVAGITFSSNGQYKFYSTSASSNATNLEIENPYGWSKLKMGGAGVSVIDMVSPFASNITGATPEYYDLRILNSDDVSIVTGVDLNLRLNVGGATGVLRNWGICITGGTGITGGMVGIRTNNPTMSLDVRGSGIKVGPSLYDGNTTNPAPAWNTVPTQGMFYGGMFNSTGLTTINTSLQMGSALFPENPNGMYTVDPGSGISILQGNTVTIQSGFTWKIL